MTVLTGCSSGFDATSGMDYAPSDGVIAGEGSIRVLNALVVAAEDADDGLISMKVVNRGDTADRITGIESDAGEVAIGGDAQLPAGGAVSFGADGTSATISGISKEPGQTVRLIIRFAKSEPLTLRTVVVEPTDYYEGLTPSASPTPTPTPTETPTESPSATESAG